MKKIAVLLFLMVSVQCFATEITSKKVSNFYGVTYQGIEVRYQKDSCGYLSENVLLNVAHDSEAGVFDWKRMEHPRFRHKVLRTECRRLRDEMVSRGLMDTILNREVKR
jgi:hypothetical protein